MLREWELKTIRYGRFMRDQAWLEKIHNIHSSIDPPSILFSYQNIYRS